jgi:oxygen-independent coproporphyrinogen-3 oxidase
VKPLGIYIHIPFCEHKCIYCDFYSVITKSGIEQYIHSIKKEINYHASLHAGQFIGQTIYFGGGTPSLMTADYINSIIQYLQNHFVFDKNVEVTLETNPGTVTDDKLKEFRQAGINRLSIGIQSFDENDLKFLTRIHDKKAAIKTVENAFNCGFDNINVDLIFNLPGQTKEKWRKNLETAITLPIKHISAYSLILERGTILNKMVLDGKVKISDADFDAELYELTIDLLTKYYFAQYEVSNFAQQGYECRHNNIYWRYKDYLGFGTSSHSFINKKRWWNYSALNLYSKAIEQNGNAVCGSEAITGEKMFEEYIMLALRSSGIDKEEFISFFGNDIYKKTEMKLKQFDSAGYLYIDQQIVKLISKGYPVCDEIVEQLI